MLEPLNLLKDDTSSLKPVVIGNRYAVTSFHLCLDSFVL